MDKLNPPQIEAEIARAFPAVTTLAANSTHWRNLLADYCAIGSLLTDRSACLEYLKVLNDDMEKELGNQLAVHAAEQRNQFWVGRPLSQFGQIDAVRTSPRCMSQIVSTPKPKANADDLDEIDLSMLPKFYGVLQRVLQREENRFGFNGKKVVLPNELIGHAKVGQTPTLTGFFHPESFNEMLLKQGYHWKDPGAGIAHGEFTHRIQWFIIQQASFIGEFKTRNNVLRIYQSLALPECMSTGVWSDTVVPAREVQRRVDKAGAEIFGKRTMWDLLVDCITEGSKQFGPRSNTYRCPEVLNLALVNKGNDQWIKDNLPVLSNYLRARNTKRAFYETRDRMGDQFIAMRAAMDAVSPGRYDASPGKQQGPADGRAVWRRDRSEAR